RLLELQRTLPAHMRERRVIRGHTLESASAGGLGVLARARADLVAARTKRQRPEAEQVAVLVDATAQGDAGSVLSVRGDSANPPAVHALSSDGVGCVLRLH